MKTISLVFAFSLIVFYSAFAQDSDTTTYEYNDYSYEEESEAVAPTLISPEQAAPARQYQSEQVTVKEFDKATWKKVVGAETFQEEPEKSEAEPEKSDAETPRGPAIAWNNPALQIIAWIVIGGVVITILYLILRNFTFANSIKKEKIEGDTLIENIERIDHLDIDALLQKALNEKKFHLAVRLYYLRLLQELNEIQIIVWKKDKTNKVYLDEVFSKNFHYDDVRRLTLAYEQVWYGEYALTPEIFERLQSQFEKTHRTFSSTKQTVA